jgi:predicted metal-dependent hydrolase
MVHLLERHHDERFKENMDRFLPQWRVLREQLNELPVRHEKWAY